MDQISKDVSLFLRPTFFIDSDHEVIAKLAAKLTRPSDPPEVLREDERDLDRPFIKGSRTREEWH